MAETAFTKRCRSSREIIELSNGTRYIMENEISIKTTGDLTGHIDWNKLLDFISFDSLPQKTLSVDHRSQAELDKWLDS